MYCVRSDVIDKKKVNSYFFTKINLISWRFGLFGLIEKVKWLSAQRKLSPKGLTYLLHVSSFGLSPNSSEHIPQTHQLEQHL